MQENEFLDTELLSGVRRDGPLVLPWPGTASGARTFSTVSEWRAFISALSLPVGIPEIIAAKYRRAQMLYFLAWSYFDLIKAGELVALSTLELALNDRYGARVKKRGKYRSFADLLKYMMVDGLTDDKIPMVQNYGGSVIGSVSGDSEPSLAERRNTMAHGDPFDGFPVGGLLELVRDLITYSYRDLIESGATATSSH